MKDTLATLLATYGDTYAAGEVPQGKAAPYIAWQRITSMSPHHLTGVHAQREETFSIEAYGATEAEADSLAESIRDALDGASTALSAEWCVVENVIDYTDLPPFGGGERPLFRTVLTVRIWWQNDGGS